MPDGAPPTDRLIVGVNYPAWKDPTNPVATGYDVRSPEFIRARTEAITDPLLSRFFDDVLRAEAAAFRSWARAWAKEDGCRPVDRPWPEHTLRTPAELLDDAKARTRKHIAYVNSPRGHLSAAIRQAREAAQEAARAIEAYVDALSRNPATAPPYAAKAEAAATAAYAATVIVSAWAEKVANPPQPDHVADLHRTIHDIVMTQAPT